MTARFAASIKPTCLWLALLTLLATQADAFQLDADRPDRYEAEADVDWPLYLDPLLQPAPRLVNFDPRLKEIWLLALDRPDAETRRHAAAAIGRAHSEGMTDLADMAPKLVDMLKQADQHPVVRLAVAKTLIQLDYREATPALLTFSDDRDMALLMDPALARWQVKQAIDTWRQRLDDAEALWVLRRSAIRSLGAIGDQAAAPSLRKLALAPAEHAALRLAAARAHGQIVKQGQESAAASLAEGDLISRLVGVSLIALHSGEQAQGQLLAFARDAEPAVAAVALTRLLEIDPLLISPIVSELISNPDAKVRRLVAQAVVAQRDEAAVATLRPLLNDFSPSVRRYVRREMLKLAEDAALDGAVRKAAVSMLGTDQWRGLEQAAIILGRLDHETSASRLVELMRFPRPEVQLAAIVALRRLEVKETLPDMLAQAERLSKEWQAIAKKMADAIAAMNAPDPEPGQPSPPPPPRTPRKVVEAYDKQMAQLFQAFGIMRYAPAEPLMQKYIPKDSGYNAESRAGAIWAMGYLHENQPDDGLVQALRSRLSDINPMFPEATPVRRASAISLGRMKARNGMKVLEMFEDQEKYSAEIGGSCRWALIQITGRERPPLPALTSFKTGWFLQTLKPRDED